MPLKLKGSSSGDVTLDVPAAAGTNTLTLPARTGNIITSADSGTVTGTMLASATVTQSNLASNIAGNGPTVIAYAGTTTSISANTYTRIAYNTTDFNLGGCFNNTASNATLNGITVPPYSFLPNVAGFYQVNGGYEFSDSTASFVNVALYKNTSRYASGNNSAVAGPYRGYVSAIVYLNGTSDYIGIYGFASKSGTAMNYAPETYFNVAMIRSA